MQKIKNQNAEGLEPKKGNQRATMRIDSSPLTSKISTNPNLHHRMPSFLDTTEQVVL
jgi:hypothetical protein